MQEQIDRFNSVRKVKSEYIQKRMEDMENYKLEQEMKKNQVKVFKESINK